MLGDLGRLGVGNRVSCFMYGAWLAIDHRKQNAIDRDSRHSWCFSGRFEWLSRADDLSKLGCMGARMGSEAFVFC